MSFTPGTDAFAPQREKMVREQIEARGVRDPAVLGAMRTVPREAFVPESDRGSAYADGPLPIGEGQTISQPYIVGLMVQSAELGPDDRVLEVGAGSGYAAAVMGRIAGEVYALERHKTLADRARRCIDELGYENVHVEHANGTMGWPEHAPYDAIVVAAGGPEAPPALLEQLTIGGRLVIPIGSGRGSQELVRIRRRGEEDYERETLCQVRFVPLIGREGWGGGNE